MYCQFKRRASFRAVDFHYRWSHVINCADVRTSRSGATARKLKRNHPFRTGNRVRDVIKDGDQSTSGPDDVVGADKARFSEFWGATEDDLGRDARTHGKTPTRMGRRGWRLFVLNWPATLCGPAIVMVRVVRPSVCLSHANISETKRDKPMVTMKRE